MSVLSIRELSITFATPTGPVEAVRGVSLDVERGETVAIVGASGSGKSTTAAAINRLLPPNGRISNGSVWFDDVDVAAIPERRMRRLRGAAIGFVPQDPMANLNPVMRVGDQIAEALEVHGVLTGSAAATRAVELLEMVGIDTPERRARQYPHEFSGGMRQRALIAVGLACRPRLLVADEPTSALDVTVQRRILDLIGELTAEMDTAVVLITHDLGLAAERADRIVVMNDGAIVETGPAHQIVEHPAHDYTRRLIAAAPNVATVSIAPPRPPDAETAAPLVVVEGLAKSFTLRDSGDVHVAVDDVSFTIPAAATVAIVGESGSGKSTTANMVLGLETPTAGAIRFEGADVTMMSRSELFAFRRRVQPVFQNPYSSLDPRYTVGRSIAEPLKVHGIGDRASRRASVATLLEQVALDPKLADRYPHELSGGQRQRVAIARALALSPELIVLDEAVSALDVMVQAQILELLVGLQRQLGLAYLFISHDLAVVRMISHVVHVMQRGRIVESGTPDELFADPTDPYTRELLAAIPGGAGG